MSNKTKNIIFIATLVILLSSASFGIGRLSALENYKAPIKIDYLEESDMGNLDQVGGIIFSQKLLENEENEAINDGLVVGSVNSDKYHFPWCSGAQRMLEENKIYFSSIEEAREAGYTPAANCKGLK